MRIQFGWVVAALLALLHSAAAQAAFVSWVPPVKETAVGQIGFIDILFNRTASDSGPLAGFDMLLQFNPTVLRFDAAASSLAPAGRDGSSFLPDQLGCPGLPLTCTGWGTIDGIVGQTDDSDGTIELAQVSLAPAMDLAGQARGFLLARLAFEGLRLGSTDLDILRLDLSDASGVALESNALPSARFSVVIPEPSSLVLILTALLGCAGTARRRAAKP